MTLEFNSKMNKATNINEDLFEISIRKILIRAKNIFKDTFSKITTFTNSFYIGFTSIDKTLYNSTTIMTIIYIFQ